MEQQQPDAPSRSPRKRRLSASCSPPASDKKLRSSACPSASSARDKHRQKQQNQQAARPHSAPIPALTAPRALLQHSQQATQEMDRFLAGCALWQRRLAALGAELAAKARTMEAREVQAALTAAVDAVQARALQEELGREQERLQWARALQTDAQSCLQRLHRRARETELFEAMERQLADDRVLELETQLAQTRAVEREKELELSALRADQEQLLRSSHADELETLVEQKKEAEEALKLVKQQVEMQREQLVCVERESVSLKQHNQKLLEETRRLRETQETSEFEAIQHSMTQDEEIKKLQAQLQAAKVREGKMAAALAAAKREVDKGKQRKGELKILYAKFSSTMDSVSEKTMRLEELEQEINDAKTKASDMEAQNEELAKQVAQLQQQMSDLSAAQHREKDDMNEELSKVQDRCAELRELESRQKQLASEMQAEIEELKAQNDALREQQVQMEHQSVGQPSNEGDKRTRDGVNSLVKQIAEKEALQMFVQHYYSAAEAKCSKLLEQVSELESSKVSIQRQTKESCSVLRMCTQIESCDESIRASLLDVMATLEGLA
ncbi:GTP-binding protein 2 [Phytophthora cinnamomi]|uniref:GTP-binding protein 2 n=1 Tax=Phytophthora cinnamomi TaxID=4785 RepID=UPI00355A95E3|nr:GTP-binding protein 2 [Phytophthora cinnamomi]